jgi:peroxiredoxin
MPLPEQPLIRRFLPVLTSIGLFGVAISIYLVISLSQSNTQNDHHDQSGQDQANSAFINQNVPDVPAEAPVVGARAPGFELINLDGETVRLEDIIGSPIIINFWATWCGPCRIEMALLQDRFTQLANQDLVILAVNFNEMKSVVEGFREELGLSFQILLDPGAQVQRLYRMRGYPSSFFVDTDGIIRAHHIGLMSMDQINENLTKVGLDV